MSDPTSNVFTDPQNSDAGTQDPKVPSSPSVSPDSVFTDQLAAIKNERGEQKYDDIPKALEGLQHAQEYIPQLKSQLEAKEQELAQLREAVTKHETVEDVVSRLTASQAATTTTEQSLDEQGVAALFEQLLTKRESTLSLKANQETVQNELVSAFGSAEAANKAVVAKAAELGTTAEEIGKLSAQNPKMVLELFKTVQKAPSAAPPTPSVNSDGFLAQNTAQEGLTRPEKSLLAGATYKEQLEYLRKVKEDVYKKFDITS